MQELFAPRNHLTLLISRPCKGKLRPVEAWSTFPKPSTHRTRVYVARETPSDAHDRDERSESDAHDRDER
eukprot:77533-Prymnesium_polylepis.1